MPGDLPPDVSDAQVLCGGVLYEPILEPAGCCGVLADWDGVIGIDVGMLIAAGYHKFCKINV